jgi:RimJ/RimL family protein N-acetyltransferase
MIPPRLRWSSPGVATMTTRPRVTSVTAMPKDTMNGSGGQRPSRTPSTNASPSCPSPRSGAVLMDRHPKIGAVEPAVRLVPFSAAHLMAFTPLTTDPDVLRFTRFPDPPQPAFPRDFLARYEAGRANGTREAFAVVAEEDDELVGIALAVDIDLEAGAAELGYLVAPAARGRGVGTAALALLTRWAREEAGLDRLELLIDVENVGSRTVAERCGYVLERIDEDAELRPGRRGALCVYGFRSAASGAPQDSRSSGGGIL